MNFYPNPYFTQIYQSQQLENPYYTMPELLPVRDDVKYVKILESENKLLREKI
jgi:hypothetical protein